MQDLPIKNEQECKLWYKNDLLILFDIIFQKLNEPTHGGVISQNQEKKIFDGELIMFLFLLLFFLNSKMLLFLPKLWEVIIVQLKLKYR
jgi:hypothetical protein